MSEQDTLIVWLKSLAPAEYRALPAARADAVRNWHARARSGLRRRSAAVPADPAQEDLAGALLEESSVIDAVVRLTTPQMQVFEAVQVLGDGGRRSELRDLLDVPDADTGKWLDEVLGELAKLALVWPDGDRLRLGTVAAWLETRIGGPLGAGLPLDALLPDLPTDVMRHIALNLGLNLARAERRDPLIALLARTLRDADLVRSVAAEAPAATRKALDRLASFGLPGTPGTASEALDLDVIMWAAARGLVILDAYQLAMPREVRLALRGLDYRAPFEPVPPRLTTTAADARPGEAANAATRAVELTEAILHECAARPLSALKSGGVGSRELNRLAKCTGCLVPTLRLLLEVVGGAGLIAWERGVALPTGEFDAWLSASTPERIGVLLEAWWRMDRLPLFVPEGEKPEPCLQPEAGVFFASPLRQAVVRTAATVPPGRAVSGPGALVDGVLWRLPMSFEEPEDAGLLTATIWDEAVTLGVIADYGPSPLAAGLASGRAAESVGELFADETTAAVFQNDLTAIVAGLPSLALSELLDGVADREARGTASIWRFSPDSVRRGLDRGLSAETLCSSLVDVSHTGDLPNVLRHLIEDVARRHGEVRVVATGCCLTVSDPALAEELVRVRVLEKLRLRAVAPGVLVSALDPATTLDLLRQAGYVPSAEAQDGTAFVARSTRRTTTRPRGR
ncbi:helicase-associated domain-containing protein [Actinoallomurus sp. NBC_01490]|uniref:helicase-associated domain-containing protein n=1 Tax=Actinoallomurus sp. NBC_01490 TaxID=2903557 RepID=UPI002E31B757|nr:helicase-associated domain-containing protein [Actinoallomurus sp. NBC_01490]